MLKKLLVISSLTLSLVGPLRTNVNAQVCEPTLLAFYGICFMMSIDDFSVEAGSVTVDSILKKLQNTNISQPSYEVVLFLQQASARCTNPGGKSENANGNPFDVNVAINQTQAIKPQQVTKNGKALSEIVFSDADLVKALAPVLGNVCKPNWSLTKIAVNKMQVFGTLFSCENGGDQTDPRGPNPCLTATVPPQPAIADALGKECVVPSGQDPFKTPFKYDCAAPAPGGTLCEGAFDPNNPASCPLIPHELPSP